MNYDHDHVFSESPSLFPVSDGEGSVSMASAQTPLRGSRSATYESKQQHTEYQTPTRSASPSALVDRSRNFLNRNGGQWSSESPTKTSNSFRRRLDMDEDWLKKTPSPTSGVRKSNNETEMDDPSHVHVVVKSAVRNLVEAQRMRDDYELVKKESERVAADNRRRRAELERRAAAAQEAYRKELEAIETALNMLSHVPDSDNSFDLYESPDKYNSPTKTKKASELRKARSELEKASQSTRERHRKVREILDQERQRIESVLTKESTRAKKDLADLSEAIQSKEMQAEQVLEDFIVRYESQEATILKSQKTIEELRQHLLSSETRSTKYLEELARHRREIESLQVSLGQIEKERQDQIARAEKAENELERARKEINRAVDQQAQLRYRLEQSRARESRLNYRVDHAGNEAKTAQEMVTIVQRELEEANSLISHHLVRIASMEKQLAEVSADKSRLEHELVAREQRYETELSEAKESQEHCINENRHLLNKMKEDYEKRLQEKDFQMEGLRYDFERLLEEERRGRLEERTKAAERLATVVDSVNQAVRHKLAREYEQQAIAAGEKALELMEKVIVTKTKTVSVVPSTEPEPSPRLTPKAGNIHGMQEHLARLEKAKILKQPQLVNKIK